MIQVQIQTLANLCLVDIGSRSICGSTFVQQGPNFVPWVNPGAQSYMTQVFIVWTWVNLLSLPE